MSRSIRGGDKRAKRLCGRVAHEQTLTRANKRLQFTNDDANSSYQLSSKDKII